MTSEMLAKLTSRLGELSAKEEYGGTAAILAWATNVLTVLEAVCGLADARSKTLRTLIEKTSGTETVGSRTFVNAVKGFAKGVHDDLQGGYFVDLTSRIRSEVESDFLGQAHRLLEDGLKDPAAMLVGAVLEDALRQLCQQNGLEEGPTIEPMNDRLQKAGVYAQPQRQQITTWGAIRNKADHGRFDQYSREEVRLMHQGVASFIATRLG